MTAVGDLSTSLMAAGPSVSSQLFGSALIGVREGLEAAIVVTILVAFLVKSDRRDAIKWVWLGVGGAIAMTIAVFLAIHPARTPSPDSAPRPSPVLRRWSPSPSSPRWCSG